MIRYLFTILTLLAASSLRAQDFGDFKKDSEAIAAPEHRLFGTPESKQVNDYIINRLKEIGIEKVIVQPFQTIQMHVKRCELIMPDQTVLPLLPMRPNGIMPPSTPVDGVSGKLVDFNADVLAQRQTPLPENFIAVLDYESGQQWLDAVRRGAGAIIFTKAEKEEAWHTHYTEANINIPRYYYNGNPADLTIGKTVTLHASITWKRTHARNIFAWIPGTDPLYDEDKGEEVAMLAAHTDSYGEVPHLSNGARAAANCAGLLQLAEKIHKEPSKRHTLIAFFSAQSRLHYGASQFYRLFNEDGKITFNDNYAEKGPETLLENELKSFTEEQAYIQDTLELYKKNDPLAVLEENKGISTNTIIMFALIGLFALATMAAARFRHDKLILGIALVTIVGTIISIYLAIAGQESTSAGRSAKLQELLVNKLKLKSEAIVFDVKEELKEYRLEVADIEMALHYKTYKNETQGKKRIAELKEKINSLEERKRAWNAARRDLSKFSKSQNHQFSENSKKLLDVLHEEIKKSMHKRQQELDLLEVRYAAEKELVKLLEEKWINVHLSLTIGDRSPRWGLIVGEDSLMKSGQDRVGLYNGIQKRFYDAATNLKDAGKELKYFEIKSADQSIDETRALWAAPFMVHSGSVAGKIRIYNLALGTIQENLQREGTPLDTIERLDLKRMYDQFEDIYNCLNYVFNDENLSISRTFRSDVHNSYTTFENNKPQGTFVMSALSKSMQPKPGAVIKIVLRYSAIARNYAYQPNKIYGFDNYQIITTNENGSYHVGPTSKLVRGAPYSGFAALFDENGLLTQGTTGEYTRKVDKRLNIVKVRTQGIALPPQLKITPPTVMQGSNNGPLNPKRNHHETFDGFVYWFTEPLIKDIKVFHPNAAVILGNGPEGLVDPQGIKNKEKSGEEKLKVRNQTDGLSLLKWDQPSIARRSASDIWRLNEERLETLRKRGIMNESMEALHGRSEDLLIEAEKNKGEILKSNAKSTSAFHIQGRLHGKIKEMINDLIVAVLVLLALCVPFAFVAERLLIGATIIYKQIIGFTTFFTLAFFALFFSHPAFAISNTPAIIFLGFTTILLSGLVIFIIMRKFEQEIKSLQGMETSIHAADVSRITTIIAAMSMGISSMRRRPLRTTLTAVTIILLTFTILCFASFGASTKVITFFSQPSPDYSSVHFHRHDFQPIEKSVLDLVRNRWQKDADVCRRYWITSSANKRNHILVSQLDGSNPFSLEGLLGIDLAELKNREALGKLIDANPETFNETVWITEGTAKVLGVKPGDKILVRGCELTVGKLIDAVRLSVISDIDDNAILPVDFSQKTSQQQEQSDEEAALTPQNWEALSTDNCLIVSADTAITLNANLHAVTIYTKDTKGSINIAEELARVFPEPVYATRNDGAYIHILGSAFSASGINDLLFPILLGGLVIFGTMLGSVADRQKEIYTFSALGLAPPHVAGLFFAEALVFSILGGLSGYLLAQGVMKILTVVATYTAITVPEMNFSSTNAIVTILLVMLTVLVSALYPAIKASRSANPGVARNWQIPAANGDIIDMVFPFTVSDYDITGVVSFLKEHFDSYTDTGLGCFTSMDTEITYKGKQLGIKSQLALAPFDLGVTQVFELSSVPSEIEGIDEVAIRLTRKSGQPKDWQRLNKVLLDDLRKQFLLWRALPQETMDIYRQKTLEQIKKLKEA